MSKPMGRKPAVVIGIIGILALGGIIFLEYYEPQTIEEVAIVTETIPVEPVAAPEPEPAEEPVKTVFYTDKEIEQLYNYSLVLADYGQPLDLNDHSFRMRESERYKATGFFDAVTYTDISEENRKADGWIEQFVSDEIRSNPIYASGAFLALQEIGVIGKDENASEWSKIYNENREKIFYWVDGNLTNDQIDAMNDGELVGLKLTPEYNEYASYIAELLSAKNNKGIHSTKEGWKVLRQYALDPDKEIIVESTKNDKYDFWVFEFLYKDGTKKYIGINCIDFRFLILDPPSNTPTPKKTTTTPKKPAPTPAPTPEPQPTPNPNPNPNPDPQPDPKPKCGTPDDSPNAQDEIKDNQLTDFEPTKPEWPSTPTVIVGDDTSDRKPKDSEPVIDPTADVIDQNRPDYSPIPVHDTSYVDESTGQTYSAQSEPVNNGTVDPF